MNEGGPLSLVIWPLSLIHHSSFIIHHSLSFPLLPEGIEPCILRLKAGDPGRWTTGALLLNEGHAHTDTGALDGDRTHTSLTENQVAYSGLADGEQHASEESLSGVHGTGHTSVEPGVHPCGDGGNNAG
jgi:hypothetical protein